MAEYASPTITAKDALVALGLGRPVARSFVAAVAVAGGMYIVGKPNDAFTDDGAIRPFAPLTPGPDGVTFKHFLVVPLVAATAVYLFT